ncbi:MAG: EscN/YscN/HrcN family type III secretion system ATPase, partial [Gemmatimonadetes bacterium]|nr:EscN/YscN/HrcN family type III secretion system ATPase [Gemmatimonadota bacterium]
LPRLLERAGNAARGSITGVYSVLVEGDDFSEPVADATRSILDGHIVLSRDLAAAGHFPAIDILASKSRLSDRITDVEQRRAAAALLRLEAVYREKEDLIAVGAYQTGTAPLVDVAIQLRPRTSSFLQQDPSATNDLTQTRQHLLELTHEIERVEMGGAT